MDREKESVLVGKYPKLLKDYDGKINETCLAFGLQCNDGWYDLIDNLLNELSVYEDIVITQIKEKFGTLRVYVSGMTEDTFDKVGSIISKYEELSSTVCEDCGKRGRLVGSGWLRTVCKKCEAPEPSESSMDIIQKLEC